MINIVALCLVLTTLATAGVFSPSPTPTPPEKLQIKQDVIVKEGHRTVEIEYEQNDVNTKVKISPQDDADSSSFSAGLKGKASEAVETVKEKLEEGHSRVSPRELVCNVFGKCKHKVASAFGKTKEAVAEKAHEAAERSEEKAKHKVVERVKDAVSEKAHEAAAKVGEAGEAARHKAGEAVEKAKDAVLEKALEAKEMMKESAKVAIDDGKTLKDDVKSNLSKQTDGLKRKAKEKIEHEKKYLREILRRGGEFAGDVFGYVWSPESRAQGVGIMQLLGLGMAFGMSIWVTFFSSYILAGALPRQQFAVLQSKIYPVYFRAMVYSVGIVVLGHLLSPKSGLYSGKAEALQGFNLVAALSMLLFNLWHLEPRATKVMFEKMKLEKEEGRGLSTIAAEPSNRAAAAADDNTTLPPSSAVTRLSSVNTDRNTVPSSAGAAPRTREKPKAAAPNAEMIRLHETLKRLNSYSSFLNILTLMALTWHLVHLGQILHVRTEC